MAQMNSPSSPPRSPPPARPAPAAAPASARPPPRTAPATARNRPRRPRSRRPMRQHLQRRHMGHRLVVKRRQPPDRAGRHDPKMPLPASLTAPPRPCVPPPRAPWPSRTALSEGKPPPFILAKNTLWVGGRSAPGGLPPRAPGKGKGPPQFPATGLPDSWPRPSVPAASHGQQKRLTVMATRHSRAATASQFTSFSRKFVR